jgi:hypothetical protein
MRSIEEILAAWDDEEEVELDPERVKRFIDDADAETSGEWTSAEDEG